MCVPVWILMFPDPQHIVKARQRLKSGLPLVFGMCIHAGGDWYSEPLLTA